MFKTSTSFISQIYGKINKDGVFLEQLETNPAKYLPDISSEQLGGEVVKVMHVDGSVEFVSLLNAKIYLFYMLLMTQVLCIYQYR